MEEESCAEHGQATGDRPRSRERKRVMIPQQEELCPQNSPERSAEKVASSDQQVKSAPGHVTSVCLQSKSAAIISAKGSVKEKRRKRGRCYKDRRLKNEFTRPTGLDGPTGECENIVTEEELGLLLHVADALTYLEKLSSGPWEPQTFSEIKPPMEVDDVYEEVQVELVAELEVAGGLCAEVSTATRTRFGEEQLWRLKDAVSLGPPSCWRRLNSSPRSTCSGWHHGPGHTRTMSSEFSRTSFCSSLCSPSAQDRRQIGRTTAADRTPLVFWDRLSEHVDLRTKAADAFQNGGLSPQSMQRLTGLSHLSFTKHKNVSQTGVFRPGWTPDLPANGVAPTKKPSGCTAKEKCWGVTLGNGAGVSNGQTRPQNSEGFSSSSNQHSQSSQIPLDRNNPGSSSHQHGAMSSYRSGASEMDMYDPFHPTDEDNFNGDSDGGEPFTEDSEECSNQKYDPFEPTGSNPSSPESSLDQDDEKEDFLGMEGGSTLQARAPELGGGSRELDCSEWQKDFLVMSRSELQKVGTVAICPEVSESESRGSDVLAQQEVGDRHDFDYRPKPILSPPMGDFNNMANSELEDDAMEGSGVETEEQLDPNGEICADSTLRDQGASQESESDLEQRRRSSEKALEDIGGKMGPKVKLAVEAGQKLEPHSKSRSLKSSLVEAKPRSRVEKSGRGATAESKLRHKSRSSSEKRESAAERKGQDYFKFEDSEIEEGEIVQPDDDHFSPIRAFRSRGRILERTLRVVEGDDFISLHADSDDEGALQIDFGDSQSDARWKGIDLRRKITSQRRERYRKHSRSPSELKRLSESLPRSNSQGKKKPKKEHKRSRSSERKRSESKESHQKSRVWPSKRKSKSRSKSKDRRRSISKSRYKSSRSRSRDRRRSRSWSPSVSTSVSAVGSLRMSAERKRSRRSKSRERGHCRGSRSMSMDRPRKDKQTEKSREREGSKKRKRSRSKSRDKEKRSTRRSKERSEKEQRERHAISELKEEKPLSERRRDSRPVVPPSIQDLNDDDLFTIKRTITVNPDEKVDEPDDLMDTPEDPVKRDLLYDSDGMSYETSFSDREPMEERENKSVLVMERHEGRSEASRRKSTFDYDRRHKEGESKSKSSRERERRRPHGEEKSNREKRKKKSKESQKSESESSRAEKGKERTRPEKEKSYKKLKSGHKESKDRSIRKVKLQSKVSVLIREGVSSTTTTVKEAGSIGVKFSRDRESRSPFLKSEEKVGDSKPIRPKLEVPDSKDMALKPKKIKGTKTKTGLKKAKMVAAGKAKGIEKKKKKLKAKTVLKKSKADSCSKEIPSPVRVKEESLWSGSEKSESKPKPPSPPKPINEQELTPDSQTVDSSCKTPDVLFISEEQQQEEEQQCQGKDELDVENICKVKEEQARVPTSSQMPWNLQAGVDCAAGGVLALTALLFKMEEANLASRAKAHELIQATNQILSQTKPSTPLVPPPPPPSTHMSVSQPTTQYILHSTLPLVSCSSTPPSSTPLASVCAGQSTTTTAATSAAMIFSASSSTETSRREGSVSSDGRGDTDKYLKKLHTQERAVEEVKLAIKPYYQKKEITKEEYKGILRKAVHKICHSKSGEINPVKVNNLVKAYVQRYKYFRKHGRKMDEEDCCDGGSGSRSSGGGGSMMTMTLDNLPLPPL
ncbi:splicing factor, arginine/serine-rich 19 [Latimeria chalumnae]|uniref:splicing factor, arginine/serine-rich 19 n=1 Tax=Latimeria chalumnae TaxID=7897 RepID=UPI0003C18BDD|nr:PREDICTED: splicing factor, arginine/serine-rich 19 [Latimeria chalumnae]|eukprot:XP_005991014.1 PREDICTED: splicing factor, arginine/serine-rich 19 [Latimeria chalumnae]